MLAEAIEGHHGADLAGVREELSHHYQRSDLPERALVHLLAAGDAMTEVHAHGKALEHYQHAIVQFEERADRISDWFAIHERIGDSAIIVGDLALAQSSFEIIQEATIEQEQACVELDAVEKCSTILGRIRKIAMPQVAKQGETSHSSMKGFTP